MRTNFIERRSKSEYLDRSFDLKFWEAQPAKARFNTSWELAVHSIKVKERDVRQLPLQRDVEKFGRQGQ